MSANNNELKSEKRKNSLTPNSGEQTKRQIPNMAATTPPIVYVCVEVNNRHSESSLQTCTPQHNSQQLIQATSQSFVTSPQGYNVWAMTPEPINPNIPVQIAMPVNLNQQSPIACESRAALTTRNNVNTQTLIEPDQCHSKFIAEIISNLKSD